jgi:hypothetical protein
VSVRGGSVVWQVPLLLLVMWPLVVTWPLAPVIHPVSSGSQGWGRVLGCRCCCGCRSTCDPPHEQLLMGLGAGGHCGCRCCCGCRSTCDDRSSSVLSAKQNTSLSRKVRTWAVRSRMPGSKSSLFSADLSYALT